MAEQTENKEFGRKCSFSGKPIKRVRRYYRNGLFYANKAAYKAKAKADQDKKAETAEASKGDSAEASKQ